ENKKRRLPTLSIAIMLSVCGISVSHAENIVADGAAPAGQQADIKIEPNISLSVLCSSIMNCGETTTINIQSADKNGLSHNKYTKFDIPHFQDVVILNNILSNEDNGNPNLVNSAAKIILNEVRSPQASLLNGSVALSGQNAHVIIANPSGIDCNGCSFTNMSHLTLTTGVPSFSLNNKLLNFRVIEGEISINRGVKDNSGLNHRMRGGDPAYLNLFSESVKINGKLKADDVLIVAGKNRVKHVYPGQRMGISPLVAYLSIPDHFGSVDVGEMGGMYANRIRIISEGNITNNNEIHSKGAIQMVSGGNIENSLGGDITGGTLLLYSSGKVNNSKGVMMGVDANSKSTIKIKANSLVNTDGKVQAYGKRINVALNNPIENNFGDISVIGGSTITRLKI
ncbi:TPA: filamentous hemagglutinin N-terminal domain-containing protein, partial [Yersinia enterocolitica]